MSQYQNSAVAAMSRITDSTYGALCGAVVIVTIAALAMLLPSANPVDNSTWFMVPYKWVVLPTLFVACLLNVVTSFFNRPAAGLVACHAILAAIGVGALNNGWYWETGAIAICASVMYAIQYFTEEKQEKVRALATSNGEDASQDDQDVVEQVRFRATRSKVDFSRIVGMADLKRRLLDAGREIVTAQAGKKQARNGVLLYGEPGNGKTFFAEALAGELKLPLISVSNSDLASRWINNTTENVSKLFADARAQAPCVLFIDEIDSLITSREDSGAGYEEGPRITNALLTELVDMRSHKVVIMAATNFLDKLDGAAIREGRFDFKVEVTPPDKAARTGLIKASMRDFAGVTLAPAALEQASARWDGFSVARIRAVIEEAGREAVAHKIIVIDYPALQAAMRQIQGNQGDRLPENTPHVEELTMDQAQRSKLLGIAHRMENIEEIEGLGGSVPTGVAFYGPPGTGKTLTVRALAKTTGWALISTSGSDLMATTNAIDKLVAQAKNIRPVIVFIDEADDVLGHRRGAGGVATVTNKLLAAIDGAKGKAPDIVWVAATNHIDEMDDAALRGGRFTEKIEFREADLEGATALADEWMRNTKAPLDEDLSLSDVAALLEGESPANIKAVLQQSVNTMIERRAHSGVESSVSIDDVIEARKVVLGR